MTKASPQLFSKDFTTLEVFEEILDLYVAQLVIFSGFIADNVIEQLLVMDVSKILITMVVFIITVVIRRKFRYQSLPVKNRLVRNVKFFISVVFLLGQRFFDKFMVGFFE